LLGAPLTSSLGSASRPTAQIAKDASVAGEQRGHHCQTADRENDNQEDGNVVVHFISHAQINAVTEIQQILFFFLF